MAIIIAHAQRLSDFFNKLARRLYDARLVKAERELKRHRPFCTVDRAMKDMVNLRLVAICSNIALHHVWVSVRPAARIDSARHPLATERLAFVGGVEAAQCDNGGSPLCFGANHR
jgi:hypothetical protein